MITIREHNANFEIFFYDKDGYDGDVLLHICEDYDTFEGYPAEESLREVFEAYDLFREDFTDEEYSDLENLFKRMEESKSGSY